MTKILAIDPGTKEVGLYDGENRATFVLSRRRNADLNERYVELAVQLADFLQKHGPYDFVVYEEQFVRGNAATRALYGAIGIIRCVAASNGAGTMPIPQSTVNKWVKQLVTEYTENRKELAFTFCKMNDITLGSEHEYDAACLWRYIKEKGIVE